MLQDGQLVSWMLLRVHGCVVWQFEAVQKVWSVWMLHTNQKKCYYLLSLSAILAWWLCFFSSLFFLQFRKNGCLSHLRLFLVNQLASIVHLLYTPVTASVFQEDLPGIIVISEISESVRSQIIPNSSKQRKFFSTSNI